MGLRRFLTVMGLGAGLMYLYDPDQGNRRRAMLSERIVGFQNDTQDFFDKAKRDLQNRREGMKAEPITGGLGGLSGEWTPGVRLVAALAGGGMTFYGLAKSGLSGVGATLLGLNLVSRSIFNRSMSEEMAMQSEQMHSGSSGYRASNGQKRGRRQASSGASQSGQQSQASGVNASLTSEQGASSRAYPGNASMTGMSGTGDAERNSGDESVGFDSMLPGNPTEGGQQ